jgi:hypothetical protein
MSHQGDAPGGPIKNPPGVVPRVTGLNGVYIKGSPKTFNTTGGRIQNQGDHFGHYHTAQTRYQAARHRQRARHQSKHGKKVYR